MRRSYVRPRASAAWTRIVEALVPPVTRRLCRGQAGSGARSRERQVQLGRLGVQTVEDLLGVPDEALALQCVDPDRGGTATQEDDHRRAVRTKTTVHDPRLETFNVLERDVLRPRHPYDDHLGG